MDLEDIEKRIDRNTTKLEELTNQIQNNSTNINKNLEQIRQNSGALDILKAFKTNGDKYFVIWIITFIALLGSVGYNIYLLNEYQKVESIQDVEQSNDSGDNNYIGRDGDINGKAED